MSRKVMTSTRPYLIRAFYDWIVFNNCTPHIVVNAFSPDVEVPTQYIEGGQIVLNIAMAAVDNLVLGDESIEFRARFGGKLYHIHAPIYSILAIYAKENGRGMVFAEEDEEDLLPPAQNSPKSKKPSGRTSKLSQVESVEAGKASKKTHPTEPTKPPKGGKPSPRVPHLTIVK